MFSLAACLSEQCFYVDEAKLGGIIIKEGLDALMDKRNEM